MLLIQVQQMGMHACIYMSVSVVTCVCVCLCVCACMHELCVCMCVCVLQPFENSVLTDVIIYVHQKILYLNPLK